MAHKAGFVSIVGKPNVGKSTLMNALIGERLSIITPKAQTTRHRIMGIMDDENFQIVFSDTPGIIDPHYKLHGEMMSFVRHSFIDADVILYLTEINMKDETPVLSKEILELGIPIIVVVNKIDLNPARHYPELDLHWQSVFPGSTVCFISALDNLNTEYLVNTIVSKLPESPKYYPSDQLTDRPVRFFISEIIREKILLNFQKEIPYSSEVVITSFKEEADITRIEAEVHVMRESQKAILLGHKGAGIKKLGTDARLSIETFLGQKVFLGLSIKVTKNWRDSPLALKRFGYGGND